MRNILVAILCVVAAPLLLQAQGTSPNGSISVESRDSGLVVSYKQKPVLVMPHVGFEGYSSTPMLSYACDISTDYEMLSGKRRHCTNQAKEYRAQLGNGVVMVVRLYNDGVAFRYELDGWKGKTPKEQTTYLIPEGTRRWMQQWTEAYEGFFPLSTTAKVKPERSFSQPTVSAEGFNCRWGYPALIEPSDGVFALMSDANIERGQSASCLYNEGELFHVTPDQNETIVDGSWHTPWRVVIIGKLEDLVASTLVTDVCEPSQLADTSWIHPGVVSWVYWAYNHGSNDFDIISKYIDFAATLHLPYVLIDAEWDEMKNGKTVEDAVAYAKKCGVKPLIWYNSSVGWVNGAPGPKYRLNKPEDREREFAWCERIGVAGVKIDFFSGDNQMNMDYCLDLLECAARHHLLVNFHGAPIPRGWQRTWPNLLTTEGVYGAEWYNNVPTFTNRAACHNATLPFTRNVIGPMDYTPCAFSDSQHPHITTHGHELALTVLYESGLQHLADKPESFLAQPQAVQDFISTLPNVWDDTRLVGGYPGEYAVLARKCGDTWYVAGINGSDEPRTIPLSLPFIKDSRIQIFADGDPWDITTPANLPTEMKCKPRGGFVIVANEIPRGKFTIRHLAPNAIRVTYDEGGKVNDLPDWLYVSHNDVSDSGLRVAADPDKQSLVITDRDGRLVFSSTHHQLEGGEATLAFVSPEDECLYGLGQFQDGFLNVRGVPRRLTQVNTQSSIPMMISNKGYGILWNNYGMTEYNPPSHMVTLTRDGGSAGSEVVDVTSTEGGKKEVRERHIFGAAIDIAEEGDYALLLDVGQKMARRHNLCIDGKAVIDMQNLWLPPTASAIVHLVKGRHHLTAELTKDDCPVLYYGIVGNETVLRSPVANAVDYTVFVGSPDEIIATYRELTGQSPLMPQWALGYIHCRERFHSSDEILKTAQRFRQEQIPVDVIVQDWQYWGKYGWNAMQFDENYYPNPKALTDSLHNMDARLMLSVWSKIDKNSEVGRQMLNDGYYIPETDWIDFFNPDAAAAYWRQFSQRLVPLGIDAWWQDATEPENDDLAGRMVNNGKWSGDEVRNVYPLLVNKTVYEGLASQSSNRPMILTRCGFPGIQRYGSALWSGDVGNDWETFRRQIVAGLGVEAAGIPWWTYDAGGFFRPRDQYTNTDYIERMLRWIETSVYLPLMRVHGYMSDTEPWKYGSEAQKAITESINERYRLMPYIYSQAASVAFDGYTLMRPLIFDFCDDPEALSQKYEFMFGPSILVSPVTEPGVTKWRTYLPKNPSGWYDFRTGTHYDGGQTVTTDASRIPVFVRGGSILPLATGKQYALDNGDGPLEIRVYPGCDTSFTLYEDDGITDAYTRGEYTRTTFSWDNNRQKVSVKTKGKKKRKIGKDYKVVVINSGK